MCMQRQNTTRAQSSAEGYGLWHVVSWHHFPRLCLL